MSNWLYFSLIWDLVVIYFDKSGHCMVMISALFMGNATRNSGLLFSVYKSAMTPGINGKHTLCQIQSGLSDCCLSTLEYCYNVVLSATFLTDERNIVTTVTNHPDILALCCSLCLKITSFLSVVRRNLLQFWKHICVKKLFLLCTIFFHTTQSNNLYNFTMCTFNVGRP